MRSEKSRATLRCAVYTRVSTEHGLEQEFNSLDNQREASEAYVKSQAHEGRILALFPWQRDGAALRNPIGCGPRDCGW